MRPIGEDDAAAGLRFRGACLCLGAALTAAPGWALADSVVFNIDTQSMSSALRAFAVQAHMQLLYRYSVVRNLTANPVHGSLDRHAALEQIIRNTGLEVVYSSDNAATIRPQQHPSATEGRAGSASAGPSIGDRSQRGAGTSAGAGSTEARDSSGDRGPIHRSLLAKLAALFAPCGPGSGAACVPQGAVATPGPGQLQEVIVTAEKRAENAQRAAVALQVLDGEDLRLDGRKRLDDILDIVPGIQEQDGSSGITFAFRGVDTGMTGQVQPGTTVAVLMDGIYQDRLETIRAGTLDLARTEVMWGTQSTTLGPSSIAGAISLVTNKPIIGRYQASGSVEVGDYDTVNSEGALNLPLSSSQALRVAYGVTRRDGFYSNNAGNEQVQSTRVRYRFVPNDDVDLTLTLAHQDVGGNNLVFESVPFAGHWTGYTAALDPRLNGGRSCNVVGLQDSLPSNGLPACYTATIGGAAPFLGLVGGLVNGPTNDILLGPAYDRVSDPWNTGQPANAWPNAPYTDTEITQYSAELDWHTRIGTVTVLPAFQVAHYNAISYPSGDGTSYNYFNSPTTTKQFEARIASNDGSRVQWLAGAYYYYTPFTWVNTFGPNVTEGTFRYGNDLNGAGNFNCPYDASQLQNPALPYDPATNPAVNGKLDALGRRIPNSGCYAWGRQTINSLESASVFGNVVLPISARLRLIGGLRYSHDERRKQDNSNQLAFPPFSDAIGAFGNSLGPLVPYDYRPPYICLQRSADLASCLRYSTAATWTATTWRVGLEYDLGRQQLLYATWATGYQPGNITFVNDEPTASGRNVNDQLTVGLKSRFLDQRLQINAEAFILDFKNRPFNDSNNVGAFNFANSGNNSSPRANLDPTQPGGLSFDPNDNTIIDPKQISRGIDIDVAFLPTPVDRINLSLELLDASYGANPIVPTFTMQQVLAADPNVDAAHPTPLQLAAAAQIYQQYLYLNSHYKGVILQEAPRYSGTLTWQHRFGLPDGSSLTPRLNLLFKGKYWAQGNGISIGAWGAATAFDPGSPLEQRAYTLWNANLIWSSAAARYTVGGYVHNIRRKVVMTNVGADPSNQLAYVSLEPPRTFGVTFSAAF
jgi:iron complex outermembrane receptor protein